jgi:alginate O-acetyltransferase complex protein AlgI
MRELFSMSFNSYSFIFCFLPVAVIGFFAAGRWHASAAAAWLAIISVSFYSMLDWRFTPVLLTSVGLNYLAGRLLVAPWVRQRAKLAAWLLGGCVGANMLALAFFKYLGFFAGLLPGPGLDLHAIALPIGISFFTFTQIAFLVDVAAGRAGEASFVQYLLFVTYFPHLIAGPVLHHADMIPQFRRAETYVSRHDAMAVGLSVFLLGLFKKSVLADNLAGIANAAFDPGRAHVIGFAAAWAGALAYTLQIYFDFSGYSDMAMGLSRLFNIRLPVNFDSPYKACSITEFWRRWHMTLSQFLRDYLYIPLGGNRNGWWRQQANLLGTMALGGLWHGAGWNFLIWGSLHGLFLIVAHGWQRVRPVAAGWSGRLRGWALTFLCVVVAWVFFRATDLATAGGMLAAMAGLHGFAPWHALNVREALTLVVPLCVVLLMPNIRELMRGEILVLGEPRVRAADVLPALRLHWRPGITWAAACFGLFAVSLLEMTGISQFLYSRF